MRRRELVKQGSRSLLQFGIVHSVFMAGDPRFDLRKNVQICSIDTIHAREQYPFINSEKPLLIIIDEAHDCTPRARKYVKLLDQYPDAHVLGFTATPFSDNSLFEFVVNPISAKEAMKEGYLVPIRPFVPSIIDVSKVRVKRTGDFDEKELFEVVSQNAIIGNIVKDWAKYATGKRTIVFAVNIEHSKMLCDAFNKAGIRAEHGDGSTSSKNRDKMYDRLRRHEIDVICNVNIASTGLDIPEIECIQFARPTNSLIYYLQMCGRGLRIAPNKTECLILDNAANILRHGSPYKDRKVTLGKKQIIREPKDLTIRTCKQCHYIFPANEKTCPNCGYINPPVKINPKEMDGELMEFFLSDEEIEQLKKSSFISDYFKLKFIQKSRGLYKKFAEVQLKKKYGEEFFNKHKGAIL